MIDEEIKRLIDEAYQVATDQLTKHKDKLDAIAKALLEFETLDGQHIKEIMEHGRLINPPKDVGKSPPPPPLPKVPEARPAKQENEDDEGLAPNILGAPA